ncbi:MAG: hypothetical protein VYE22_33725 [Myxococcota bacterium]|nr:hypothetical protein [Myxococcota bacterium]
MRGLPVAAALIGWLCASVAGAQPSALRWTAPPECPDEAAVRAEVARVLGGEWPPSEALAEATTTRTEHGFRLTLATEIDGAVGERVIEGERCEELAAATALIVALMIDPVAVTRAPSAPSPLTHPSPEPLAPGPVTRIGQALTSPGGSALAEGPPDREVEPPRVVEVWTEAPPRDGPAPRREAEETLAGFVGAVGLLDIGALPNPTPGVAIEGGVGVPLIDGRLRALFLSPSAGVSADNPELGAELMALILEARGCLRPLAEARWVGACVGVAGGAVFGEGFGVSDPSFGVGGWGSGSFGLAVAWSPVRWFDLGLEADLVVPFNPLTFFVIRDGAPIEVFTQPSVTGRFGLSAHVRF